MYHVFYPDPIELGSGDPEVYLHEEAETKEEAIELGEQAAAKYRGIDRDDVMIFENGHDIGLPENPEGHRCPHCGCLIDIDEFNTDDATEDDYDSDYGQYSLEMECPECGETIHAWFDGDLEDGLEFDSIDEYNCS